MKFWLLPLGNITLFQNLGFILFNMFIYIKNNLSPDGVVCQNPMCKVAPLDTTEVTKTPVSYSKYNPSFCLFLLWFSKTQSVINKTEINWSKSWRIYNTFNVMQTLIKYLQLTISQQVIYKALIICTWKSSIIEVKSRLWWREYKFFLWFPGALFFFF